MNFSAIWLSTSISLKCVRWFEKEILSTVLWKWIICSSLFKNVSNRDFVDLIDESEELLDGLGAALLRTDHRQQTRCRVALKSSYRILRILKIRTFCLECSWPSASAISDGFVDLVFKDVSISEKI